MREFLYPMYNANKSDKTRLKIVAHICGKMQVLHESDDAAGEFKMQGLLHDKVVSRWYINDNTLVLEIGSCPHQGVGYDGTRSMRFCMLRSSQRIIDDRAATLYQSCRYEQCPLADGRK